MDPLAQFEANRYPDWRTLVSGPDYVKLYEASLRLTPADRDLLHAAMEAQRPPVSERLTTAELKALVDRNYRWVPAPKRTPSPVFRANRCRSPSLIRRIRADRINREKTDKLASRIEATARMDMHGKGDRPPATGDGQPITPRQVLHIDGIELKGVAWGDESPSARREGIMSEMQYIPKVFDLSHMISNHNGVNAGATMSTLEDVVQASSTTLTLLGSKWASHGTLHIDGQTTDTGTK